MVGRVIDCQGQHRVGRCWWTAGEQGVGGWGGRRAVVPGRAAADLQSAERVDWDWLGAAASWAGPMPGKACAAHCLLVGRSAETHC